MMLGNADPTLAARLSGKFILLTFTGDQCLYLT